MSSCPGGTGSRASRQSDRSAALATLLAHEAAPRADRSPSPAPPTLTPHIRREHVLARHSDSVLALTVSSQSNHLFSGDQDGLIIVWELNTFSFVCDLVGHRRPILSMVLSAQSINGRSVLISSSRDNTIRVWDAVQMAPILVSTQMACSVFDMLLSGTRIFAGCLDSSIMTFDIGQLLQDLPESSATAPTAAVDVCQHASFLRGHLGYVYALVATQHLILSGSGDFTIRVWDFTTMSHKATLEGHTDSVTCLAIMPDAHLLSGSRDRTIKLWALESCHLVRSVDLLHPVISLCVVGEVLFVSTSMSSVQALDVQALRKIRCGKLDVDGTVLYMCNDRQFLFTCGTDNCITVWRLPNTHPFVCRELKPAIMDHCQPRLTTYKSSTAFNDLLIAAGAEAYIDIFKKHEIDLDALHLVKDAELSAIGIPLGTRRKILAVVHEMSHCSQRNTNDDNLVYFLQQLVAYQTVSTDDSKRSEGWNCIKFLEEFLQEIGAETQLRQIKSDCNPILIARIPAFPSNEPGRKLVFYAHYDVVSVCSERWASPPFVLTGRNGYLYGRGASDNKGPLAAFLFAIKEIIAEDGAPPLDIVLILDGEGERDSFRGGFATAVASSVEWLEKPSVILLANTVWSGLDRPCLNYGMRGIVVMTIEVYGLRADLHSGVHGGALHEPMVDLVHILSTLIDENGRVLIDGFYDPVAQMTDLEDSYYDDTDFGLDEYVEEVGVHQLRSDDAKSILKRRWREPCLTIHGVESSPKDRSGLGSIISHSAKATVSMRIVPDQAPDEVAEAFTKHVERAFARLNSGNTFKVDTVHTGNWWLGNPESHAFQAAAKAIRDVWNVEPLFIREGGTMATTHYLEEALKAPAVHIAFGQALDQAHLENERIRIKNLLCGRDVFKAFAREIAQGAPTNSVSPNRRRQRPRCLSQTFDQSVTTASLQE
ncbi:SAM domain containing protein [Plasmodiophora brassicae]